MATNPPAAIPTPGGGGAIPAPATTVTGPDAYGAAAVVGTGTTYARADHDHGLPAAPAISDTGWVPLGGWANSWGNASGPGGAASYRVTGNIVRLSGAIASGAVGYPAFTLPPGARPSYGLSLSANMGNNGGSVYSAAVLEVSTGGVCTPYFASGTYFHLDGLTFTTD
jgi:hypothetical protein